MPDTVLDCTNSLPHVHSDAFIQKCQDFAQYFNDHVGLTQPQVTLLMNRHEQLIKNSLASEISRIFIESKKVWETKISFYSTPSPCKYEAIARLYYLSLIKKGLDLEYFPELLKPAMFEAVDLDTLKESAFSLRTSVLKIINAS